MTTDSQSVSQPFQTVAGPIKTDEREWLSRQVSVALLLSLPIIYFTPYLLAKYPLMPADGVERFLGEHILIGKLIAAGQSPLWNPYLLGGAPLLGNGHPGAFYPPNWLFALFSPATSINLLVIATIYLALAGGYLYGRRAGMTRLGAVVAALAFTFGGFMITQTGNSPVMAAAAWLPWVLLAIE